MINFDEFKKLSSFEEIIACGEALTPETNVPEDYYKLIKFFFEEPKIISKHNKAQIVNIIFQDNDIVTYIVKYNKIFQNKVYKISNIPFSLNNNYNHILDVINIIFTIIPSTVILMYENELLDNNIKPIKKIYVSGYENYYYEYTDLLNKIKQHKTSRHDLNRYNKYGSIEFIPEIKESSERIKKVFYLWYNLHPCPKKNKILLLEELINNNASAFILKYKNIDIGVRICSISNNYCSPGETFDLSRMTEYHNATLFLNLFMCKFLKEYLNININFYGGYVEGNIGLKQYKDKWASGKINTYGLNKNYINDIYEIIIKKYNERSEINE